jgi:hypothetical protein
MSLQGLNDLDIDWRLRNTLTINNDCEVDGDLNTTGFIYDGGVPVNIQASNNVWTGLNTFTNFPPTLIAPINADDMATKDYTDTTLSGLGNALLASNNTWTGANTMDFLPIISNSASAGNECVNKGVADTTINATTGNLSTTNIWTGNNDFTNTLSVATPLLDAQIGNKQYVDNAITSFNASGGKVEYQEFSSSLGNVTIGLDPTIYSSMIVCMVSPGGFGNANTTATGQTIKSFGGSGGYACFKISAYTGNALFTTDNGTRGSAVGNCSFTLPSGQVLVSITGGTTGSSSASGTGGIVTTFLGVSGVQRVPGSSYPLQNPPDANTTKIANLCVYNGFGLGGSFNFQTGTDVLPTAGYILCIKFKN